MGQSSNQEISEVNCSNCGYELTGEYCSQCGQRERGSEIHLGDLAGEALGEFGRLDSRIWRTLLGLVFKPGQVTADYLSGKRARYLPPGRLYLIVSFVVFLLVSMDPLRIKFYSDAETGLNTLQAEAEQGIYIPIERADGSQEMISLGEFLEEQGILDDGDKEWSAPWLERIARNADILQSDPGLLGDLLTDRLPQMMFLLLPLFALLLQIAYLFSPFHYLQHLIFSLHYHTTAFLYYILLYPLKLLLPGDYGGLVLLALFIYLPMALVRIYGSSELAALSKGFVVGLSYYFLLLSAGLIFVLANIVLL